MSFKKILQFSIVLFVFGFMGNAFAIDQAAKEETSPPSEEGPITAKQIPPVTNVINQPEMGKPQQPPAADGQSTQPGQS